jgi:predicted TIM-barrel fold metal-dependent hydrolase
MTRIDTHLHLWDLKQFPYSWCAGIPALNRTFTLADYREATAGLGVERAVFMECDVDEPHAPDEARHIQSLADADPFIAGLIASGRPERDDFPAQLETLLALPKLRGIRRVLHVVPDDVSTSDLFRENVRRLGPHGLTFDICMQARQLHLAHELVAACPEVQFVLDHCGGPDIKGGAFEPWAAGIRDLARLPNLACKVSGIIVNAAENWTPADLRPWVEHVVENFGWDRVVWGGDWPVCVLAGGIGAWIRASDELFAGTDPADREKLYRANAARIYRV